MNNTLPDIYLFNPTCEYAVANGHASWQPNLLLQKMEEDLSTLPLFFARPHDVVLVKKLPPEEYIETLKNYGIDAPRFLKIQDIAADKTFLKMPKNRLLPWGWSLAAHRLLKPLKPSCSPKFISSPVAEWKAEYRELYSKKFALDILKSVLGMLPGERILPSRFVPKICTTKNELEELTNRWGKLMVKAPWSSSGRGLQPITKTPVVPKVWEKLLGIINEQGYAIAEPYLEKAADMALQFSLLDGKVSFIGVSRFLTDCKGQYQGNFLNGWPDSMDNRIAEFAETFSAILFPVLSNAIENSLLAKSFEGNLGIDTLLFRNYLGDLQINPCLEINVRQNMGLLSLHLEKILAPGVKGMFKIFFKKGKSFYSFQKEMIEYYPPQFKGTLLEKGFFPLTPALENTLFGAYLIAGQ